MNEGIEPFRKVFYPTLELLVNGAVVAFKQQLSNGSVHVLVSASMCNWICKTADVS